jgi:hypothetical protein
MTGKHAPRPRHPMPDFMYDALNTQGPMDAYRSRPPYQQKHGEDEVASR